MPCLLGIELQGARCYVMSRGSTRLPVLHADADKALLLDRMVHIATQCRGKHSSAGTGPDRRATFQGPPPSGETMAEGWRLTPRSCPEALSTLSSPPSVASGQDRVRALIFWDQRDGNSLLMSSRTVANRDAARGLYDCLTLAV